VIGALSLAVLAGCSSADSGTRPRYQGTFTVLESPEHGPQLCNSILESLPPQCSGMPVVGWTWDTVDGEETMNGTTWGRWHVTGTYDGAAFVVTGARGPAPERRVEGSSLPADRSAQLAHEQTRLSAIAGEVMAVEHRAAVGEVESAYTDPVRGVVVATSWVPDARKERYAKRHWGDDVELRFLLQPA
jgi:hypothetical protein